MVSQTTLLYMEIFEPAQDKTYQSAKGIKMTDSIKIYPKKKKKKS